jgi:3-oxoadipate enol-lactonase
MSFLDLGGDTAIFYEHTQPSLDKPTFVFVNSMSASTQVWEVEIAPTLRAAGYGTLSFDYRGQGQTKFGAQATLEPAEIISDIGRVVAQVKPSRPILVGLSVGGLFAMRAVLEGTPANGLVLINTLRKPGVLVDWIIELEGRLIEMGGMPLLMDVLRPMLAGKEELARQRPNSLSDEGYTPWPKDHPRHRLGSGVRLADWNVPYEQLDLPVLVLTGLHDRLFRVQADVDELVARLPDATVVTFEDAGHALHEERTERFVAEVSRFADTITGKARRAEPAVSEKVSHG